MKRKIILSSISVVLVSFLLCGCSDSHSHNFGNWEDHGAYQSRVCAECGFTEKDYYNYENKSENTDVDSQSVIVTENETTSIAPPKADPVVLVRINCDYYSGDEYDWYDIINYDDDGNPESCYRHMGRGRSFEIVEKTLDDSDIINQLCLWESSNWYKRLKVESTAIIDGLKTEIINDGRIWKISYNADGTRKSKELLDCSSTDHSLTLHNAYCYYNYDENGRVVKITADKANIYVSDKVKKITPLENRDIYTFEYMTLSDHLKAKQSTTINTCTACDGVGHFKCSAGCDCGQFRYYVNGIIKYRLCSACSGTGYIKCNACNGSGQIVTNK